MHLNLRGHYLRLVLALIFYALLASSPNREAPIPSNLIPNIAFALIFIVVSLILSPTSIKFHIDPKGMRALLPDFFLLFVLLLIINSMWFFTNIDRNIIVGVIPQTFLEADLYSLVIMMLLIGYSEELFFRWLPYHLSKFMNLPILASLWQILFAILHLYQGQLALATSFFSGLLFLSFLKRRGSLHLIAVTHAFYNLTIVLLARSHIF